MKDILVHVRWTSKRSVLWDRRPFPNDRKFSKKKELKSRVVYYYGTGLLDSRIKHVNVFYKPKDSNNVEKVH